MNVILKGQAIIDVKGLLTPDELERFIKEHRYISGSKKIELDIGQMSDDSIKKLYDLLDGIANDKNHEDQRSAGLSRGIVKQWQDIKKNPKGGIVSKLKNVPSALQAYVGTSVNRYLFRQLSDGNSVPYIVTGATYSPPCDYDSAHVTVRLGAHNTYRSGSYWGGGRKNSGGSSIRIADGDYNGRTMAQILQGMGYYLETPQRMAEYEKEMTRFMMIREKDGHQLNVVGQAVSSGWYAEDFRSVEKGGRPAKMVVDPKDKVNPISATTCDFWADKGEDHLWDIPFHPFIRVFDLEDHANLRVHVNNVSAYVYDKKVGDKLVLEDETKEVLEILVHHAADSFEDIISGKQGGSIVLLAGVPGVGKTLTAEIYSEVMERPLYSVQSSQLGITVGALEEELKAVLNRAERWGAILLIDEADVYVRSRGTDIEQNAIVGVFLRVLEYYRGVLFMTTNMGTCIDDAIISRLTARINYELPSEANQSKLWTILSEQNKIKLSKPELAKILTKHKRLSGRDIKNLLKLAGRVANAKGEKVTAELIDRVAKFKQC